MTERCQHADTAAAYLLGALTDGERTQFETHLADCSGCREALVALRPVVDVLATAAPPVTPPRDLRNRIMATVQAEAELLTAAGPGADRPRAQRTRPRFGERFARPLALAGSAAALALAGGLAGYALHSADDSTTRTVVQVRTVQAKVDATAAPGANAFVVLRSGVATLRVRGLPAPPPGYVYEVWLLKRGAAAPSPTDALFGVDHQGNGRVALPSTRGVEAVLVTAEPAGGSPAPTSQPVINAPL